MCNLTDPSTSIIPDSTSTAQPPPHMHTSTDLDAKFDNLRNQLQSALPISASVSSSSPTVGI